MKELLRKYSGGDKNYDIFFHNIGGKEWIEVNYLCLLMGALNERHINERHLLELKQDWPEMDLTVDDTCKMSITGYEKHAKLCVSETGFWKIVARSNSLWAKKFRASFLPTVFEDL